MAKPLPEVIENGVRQIDSIRPLCEKFGHEFIANGLNEARDIGYEYLEASEFGPAAPSRYNP